MSTRDRRILWAVRWACISFLLSLVVQAIKAATPTAPMSLLDGLGYAMESHRLPAWYTIDDDVRILTRDRRIYACITDRGTGKQWASWGPLAIVTRAVLTDGWTPSAPVATTADDYAVCSFTPPPELVQPPMAYALDGKVYRGIVHTGPPYTKTSPLDWTSMDRDFAASTSMLVGEPCGTAKLDEPETGSSDPKVGWYYVQGRGIVRCEVR